jgi:glutamate racemase
MKLKLFFYPVLIIFAFSIASMGFYSSKIYQKLNHTEFAPQSLDSILKKQEVTVLITDSGLGGLFVCANIENNLQKRKIFKKANLIFCNALPASNYLYNNLKNDSLKAAVFNSALEGMTQMYKPDMVMIACNTLSAIYPLTAFYKTTKIPVYGIIDLGAALMNERLKSDPNSKLLILGTETTVSSKAHLNWLGEQGISPDRITTQACKSLETEIQNDPQSDVVENMIQYFLDEALVGDKEKKNCLYVGLCCTHYSYSKNIFEKIVSQLGYNSYEVLDPDIVMSDFLFTKKVTHEYPVIETSVQVVSRTAFSESEIKSIGNALSNISPKTVAALKNYTIRKNLFEVNIHL